MRQTAWLNARPEKAEGDHSKAPEPTRRERLKEDGIGTPDMPPCTAPYLVGYLFEIGPTVMAGMGVSAVPHSEIESWQRNTRIRLSPWEARTLRRLSVDYAAESQKSTQRDAPSPWQSKDAKVDRLVQANVMKNAFRDLAKL